MKKHILYSIFLLTSLLHISSQTHKIYISDIINGGMSINGVCVPFAEKNVKCKISIPPGSVIKQVFLLGAEDREFPYYVPPRNMTINDSVFYLDLFTRFTGPFISGWAPLNNVTFDASFIHAFDITNRFQLINPDTISIITSEVLHDPHIGLFATHTIVIIYENPALPKMGYTIVLNEQDVDQYLTYNVQFPHPIQNDKPVGFGIWGWHMCGVYMGDNSFIFVNNQPIGDVGGEEPNATSWCSGVYPNFAHYNDSLFAFDGDTPDSLMKDFDATANIQSYIPHLTTSILIQSNEQTPNDEKSNPVGGLFFTYATPCDTFTATVQPGLMNHLCPGDSLQLAAFGGIRYEWSPAVGLSCYDCPNPVFRHDSSMAYTVRIYQSDSCSKILPVKVNINYPRFDFSVRPATCGFPNGTVTAHPLWPQRVSAYTLGTTTQADSVFTQVYGGQSYALTITDTQGCALTKTVFVPETIPTFAGFIVQPTEGNAPLEVNFKYVGSNALHFSWYFGDGDSLVNSSEPIVEHTYLLGGTYQPYLIAWLHAPYCADTFYQQVTVHPTLQVSQLLTPNDDGKNDTWLIQGIGLYPNLAVKVFNRWGNEVFSAAPYHNDWDGDKLPSATYFWIVYPLGVDQTPEEEILKGYLELMR
jgi:gliding motility-associated-like protein